MVKEEIEKARYSIGILAEITGLNPQTVRRYLDAGILRGERCEQNQYRTFGLREIHLLMQAMMYKQYGFTLCEVGQALQKSQEELKVLFEEKVVALQKEQTLLNLKLEFLQKELQAMTIAQKEPRRCYITTRPAMLGICFKEENSLLEDKDLYAEVSEWLKFTPYVTLAGVLSKAFFLGEDFCGEPRYKGGLMIRKEYADAMGFSGGKYTFEVPEKKCVHAFREVDVINELPKYIIKSHEHVLDYIHDNHLTVCGDIYQKVIYCSRDRTSGDGKHISHIWVPIQN